MAATPSKAMVQGSGTAAAAAPSAIESAPLSQSASPPLAVSPCAIAGEVVVTVSAAAASGAGSVSPSASGAEAVNKAPSTMRPPALTVKMPVLGVACGVEKSSVPPLTVVPPVYLLVPVRTTVPGPLTVRLLCP